MQPFESTIFDRFFSVSDKRWDERKDAQGKGTLERYTESLGAELDTLPPLVEGMLDLLRLPSTCLDRYLPYIESLWGMKEGDSLYLGNDLATRRKVAGSIMRLNALRGSLRGYRIMLGMLGITLDTLTEHETGYGFDSPVTLDDPIRRLDSSRCPACSDYSLDLTGPPLTPELLEAIRSIIRFNEPINARLRTLTYNGIPVGSTGDFSTDFSPDFFV